MSDTNTANLASIVVHPTPKPGVYTRDDFVRDLAKVSKKGPAPPRGAEKA